MAAAGSGLKSCPANFSASVSRQLGIFQEAYLWPILVVEFVVAMAGNGLALYRFCSREQRPWHPAVVFSAQLAVSNLLSALALPPMAAYFYPPKSWRYGEAACLLERFFCSWNLLGSVFFITCISLTRYLGVVHPFFVRSHLRLRHAWALSATAWVLAALLAAPTFSFSHLQRPTGAAELCSSARPQACVKCVGTGTDGQLPAVRAYSLVLAGLGGGLPLLLTLLAYGALARVVLHSHSMSATEKLRVALLVASGVAVYASSYVPYLVLQVLNVAARQRWLARCPSFVDEAQAVQALELGPYLGYQVTRGLVPLAMCTHPLLYMAVVPSLGCPGCGAGPSLRDRKPGQDLPLRVPASPEAQLSP